MVSAAEGEANRFEQLLTEYQRAPEVTRERLYIDAMQSVLSSSSKVLVDVEGGNNILYLPLDKLAARASEQHQTPAGISDDVVQRAADRVIDQLRRQTTSNYRRGESR